jgi:transcriptional regulator with XRE-family HTH domain
VVHFGGNVIPLSLFLSKNRTEIQVNSNQVPIGTQIKLVRLAKGLTLKDLDDLSGVTYSDLSIIERNKFLPKPDKLAAIEAALGINFSDPAVQAAFFVLLGQPDGDLPNAQ